MGRCERRLYAVRRRCGGGGRGGGGRGQRVRDATALRIGPKAVNVTAAANFRLLLRRDN